MEYEFRVRWYQRAFHEYLVTGGKRAIEIAHRRWGKDEITLAATRELAMKRVGSYWHCLPEYEQARKAIWTAVNPHTGKRRIDEAFPPEIRESKDEQQMFIRLKNSSTWQIIGSDRYNSLVGAGVCGVVFSEWALANPSSWGYIRPMVEENDGWAAFITTPRGRNHAYAMLEHAQQNPDRWFAEVSSIEDTKALTPEQLDEALAEYTAIYGAGLGKAQFEQEYLCSFDAAILGSYYGEEMAAADRKGRICTVEHQPGTPVEVWFDLGARKQGRTMAVGFVQRVGLEIHCIDFMEDSGPGRGIPWVVSELQRRAIDDGYVYGDIVMPHDAGALQKATGETFAQTFEKAFNKQPIILARDDVAPGIDAVRNTLPSMYFDRTRCAKWVEALRNYRAEYDDDKRTFKPVPVPDWSSHAADMTRYGCMHTPTDEGSEWHADFEQDWGRSGVSGY